MKTIMCRDIAQMTTCAVISRTNVKHYISPKFLNIMPWVAKKENF